MFPYNVLSLHAFISLQYYLVWTLCVACDQDLGLPLRFVNEVKVNGKVFTQWEAWVFTVSDISTLLVILNISTFEYHTLVQLNVV